MSHACWWLINSGLSFKMNEYILKNLLMIKKEHASQKPLPVKISFSGNVGFIIVL